MSERCKECGTPVDEIPLVECATHRQADKIDPHSLESAITRVEILALTAPFSDSFATDLGRVCAAARRSL